MTLWRPVRGTDWERPLTERLPSDYWSRVRRFLNDESSSRTILPSEQGIFRALHETSCATTRVVILGQDPYPREGDAEGLAFSIPRGRELTPTLKNIHTELRCDGFGPTPHHGSLDAWPARGVLLLNAALTVREGQRRSHQRIWREFTSAVLDIAEERGAIFMLWGRDAQRTARRLAATHTSPSAHPSPLSARRGFLGTHPFSRANELLNRLGQSAINWTLPT